MSRAGVDEISLHLLAHRLARRLPDKALGLWQGHRRMRVRFFRGMWHAYEDWPFDAAGPMRGVQYHDMKLSSICDKLVRHFRELE